MERRQDCTKQPEPEPQNQVRPSKQAQEAFDFLATLPTDQALANGVVYQPEESQAASMPLVLEASEATEQEKGRSKRSQKHEDRGKDGKSSRPKSRRRRSRRTSKDATSEANAKEEEEAAKAAMIKALEEDQAAVRRALAEAQAERVQREAEEAEMMRQEQEVAALEAERVQREAEEAEMMRQEQEAAALEAERVQREAEEAEMMRQEQEAAALEAERVQREAEEAKIRAMQEQEEQERLKAQQKASPAPQVSTGRARQVAQPKFTRQARSSKSLPPKKEVKEAQAAGYASAEPTRQAPEVHSKLVEGSLSLLPDMAPVPKMEEKDGRKEGHTTPTSGTQTPITKVSEPISDGTQPEQAQQLMERVFSLSTLDSLLQDPHAKTDLRHQLECDELEDRRPKYTSSHLNRPVVVVSSEVNPWSKTGGLAMVAGSYGYEFAMRGHRTMVVSPRYSAYDGAQYIGYAKIWLDGREHEIQFFHLYQDLGDGNGTDYVFVGHDCFMRGALYCDPHTGKEFPDNLFRFSLLTVAALEAPLVLNLRGSTFGQDALFIANDWQTGLLPVYHFYKYRRNNTYRNSRCVFVIHNIGYQGKFRLTKFPLDSYLGLPPDSIDFLQGEDLNLGDDCMNLMSAAILLSDKVLTVSPNYAAEIQSPEGGQGLHDILRHKGQQLRAAGILNGISDEWNPKTDPHIPTNYNIRTFEEGKAICKRELQRSLGLHEDPGAALIGFCGRLCYQKGVHLITEIIPWLLENESSGVLGRVQIILMGKGDDLYAQQLSSAENCNRGRVCGYVGFDPKVEHQMLAGCDFLLMPSQYEPCGLPQMYAQAYGTVPVVHETGGLKDSVSGLWDEQRDRDTATGFLFCGFDENHLKERMYQALEVYHKKQDLFRQIQMNGLRKNYYWPQAIDEYERQFDWTLDSHPAVS